MEPGERFGRYEILAELGRGGMATVWDAHLVGPRGFRKRVALKVLHPEVHVVDADALVREARLGAMLSHPNLVSTLELGEVDGRWFLCMERVDGPTAHALLSKGPLPPGAVVDIGLQVAAGLRHLHGFSRDGVPQPLLHRDIKPSNLLIDRAATVKIADLGISGFRGELAEAAGTPGFAPAEQISGEAVPASDVFALALTLHALATRTRLLGKGQVAMMRAAMIDGLIARAAFRDALDASLPGLADVLRPCLRGDPAERPSAGELGEWLTPLRQRASGPGLADLVSTPDDREPRTGGPRSNSTRRRGDLPRPDRASLGRQTEVDAVRAALSGPGVLAVVGPAGIGKSLVALEAASGVPVDAAHLVRGTAWTTADDLARDVAHTLGLYVPDRATLAWLGSAIRERGPLLVLIDDLGPIPDAPDRLTELARATPEARWLVTSRRRLGRIPRVELGPLAPDAAVALYLRHAHDAPDAGLARAIVEQLDGLPLAIELAAARTRHLPSARVRDALGERFRLLRDRDRALEDVIAASIAPLPDDAKAALEQLAGFEGAFTLDAAEAVVSLPGGGWVLDALEVLADHHLVDVGPDGFRLAGTVRAWALARARTDPGAIRRRVSWLAQDGTAEALDALDGPDGGRRLAGLVSRRAELEGALPWALEHAPGEAAGIALALAALYERTGPMARGAEVVAAGLSAEHTPGSLVRLLTLGAMLHAKLGNRASARGLLETGLGALAHVDAPVAGELFVRLAAYADDDDAAFAHLSRAERLANASGDLGLRCKLAFVRGQRAHRAADFEASIAAGTRAGLVRQSAYAKRGLASLLWKRGEYDEAARLHDEAARDAAACGDRVLQASVLESVAGLALDRGEIDGAAEAARRADAAFQRLGVPHRRAWTLGNLAGALYLQGHVDEALRTLEQAAARADDDRAVCWVGTNHVELLLRSGDLARAAERFAEIAPRAPSGRLRRMLDVLEVRLALARGELPRAEAALARARAATGHGIESDARVACAAAELALAQGADPAPAIAEARRLADALGVSPNSDLSREIASLEARAR